MTRTFRTLAPLVAALCCGGLATNALAGPKDLDGKRTRARKIATGAKVEDMLGPSDKADWRYLRVENGQRITVTVRFTPVDAPVSLGLVDAKGKFLTNGESDKSGTLLAAVPTAPGFY
jgi:hypothetical protein